MNEYETGDEAIEIDGYCVREWMRADRLNPFSGGQSIERIIMLLMKDPEDAKWELEESVRKYLAYVQRTNAESRAAHARTNQP